MRFFCLFIFGLSMVFLSCKGTKKLTGLSPNKQDALVEQLQKSPVFQRSFTGFALYDPATKKMRASYQADKHFTPASNAKILTLYAAWQVLGDSIPALRYVVRNDSLIFWGTGDPSFLHPDLPATDRVLQFLKARKEQLFFCGHNFQEESFGAGWSWDDFPYTFSAEKSPFPIHGNYALFEYRAGGRRFEVTPSYFKYSLQHNPDLPNQKIKRQRHQNTFEFNKSKFGAQYAKSKVPFLYSDELLIEVLGSLVERKIQLYPRPIFPPSTAKVLYSTASMNLYERMMKESDNLIAEQLLLLGGNAVNDTLNVKKFIHYAKKEWLAAIPDQLNWRDGSGLSRYNLVTPRSLVYVLDQLYREIPEAVLFDIFPAGGVSGTIKNWYKADTPYVFAKTGTLSNNHCLSGYLITKSKKRLIFSFMHNNYVTSSKNYKLEMTKVLENIRDNY
ncbi:MAG: D-alanyl-D-alanine carboxypeptidase/D-alanyl-D-alanine-endopeptidase [Saprospiraceae bacterium]